MRNNYNMAKEKTIKQRVKKESKDEEKPEYKIIEIPNGHQHQFVIEIYQKVIWKSEIGIKEEWVQVKSWHIGKKAGRQLQEIMHAYKEVEQRKKLTDFIPEYEDPEWNSGGK